MVRYLFYTIGDLTYQSPLVCLEKVSAVWLNVTWNLSSYVTQLLVLLALASFLEILYITVTALGNLEFIKTDSYSQI